MSDRLGGAEPKVGLPNGRPSDQFAYRPGVRVSFAAIVLLSACLVVTVASPRPAVASAPAPAPVVGIVPAGGSGYWMVNQVGDVLAFGAAQADGGLAGVPLASPVVGMAVTPSGRGYWLVASDGGIFAFGDAGFFGSTGAMVLNRSVVGMAASPSGRGYWLVASDGGVFTFGAAGFFGSLPARPRTAVGIHSVVVTDPTRSTPARGPTPAHDGRVLPTTIWYPTSGPSGPGDAADAAPLPGPFPLVVFAHGFNTNPATYEVLVHAWAEAGYVVAAPEFPISGSDPAGPASEADLVNQPADMSAVITFMLNGGWTSGVIDPRHVAVAGHSDGGETVVAATLNSAYHDSRITAALSLSGALLDMPGGSYGSVNNVPLLIVQGDADTINLPSDSAAVYNVAQSPKAYLDIVGGGHLPPYISPGPQSDLLRSATIDFLDAELLGDTIAPIRLGVDGNQTGYTSLTHPLA